MIRDEAEIKVPRLRRIFVCRFRGQVERLVSYVTDVAVENTDKKTSQMGVLINALFLRALILKDCFNQRI